MNVIIRIIQNAAKWRWHLVIATVSLLLVTGVNLVTPMAVRRLFGYIAGSDASSADHAVWVIAAALLGLYLLRIAFQFLSNYCAHIAAWNMVAKMRGKLYSHIQGLSLGFFTNKQTGQLMSRVIEDTANFETLIAHALPDLISSVIVFTGVLVILISINPVLAMLTCAPLPLILFCTFFLRYIRKSFSARQIISAELSSLLQDNFSGIKEIQIFNRQDYEAKRINDKATLHCSMTVKGIFWVSLLHPVVNFLSGLGTIVVVLFGGLFALAGNLNIADITVFLLYLGLFYAPVASFSRVLEEVQNALVSGRRVFEILDTQSDIKDLPGAKYVPILPGNVAFNNVSFHYAKVAVVNNVSFEVRAGEMAALVGPTGAGKTTITSLLARFYDPVQGSITIDGIDIRDMTLESLRQQISIVMQDVFLFNGTIAENIAYGMEEALPDEIIQAAKTASIDDFINGLPDKYDTRVGERGMRLSGGQKQRIALARAVLRNSPILILDEATSAVDNETEREIQTAINAIAGRRTVIIIAHRLSTVERADAIFVLNNGEIVERGKHAELLALGGLYASMYKA